jgi:hypothetical protein
MSRRPQRGRQLPRSEHPPAVEYNRQGRPKTDIGWQSMERILDSRECDRCGAAITSFCPSLPTLSFIQRTLEYPRDALETIISEREGVPKDVVREYLAHRMFAECKVVYGICPNCGNNLASRRASQCLSCHAAWHDKRCEMD